MIRPEEATGTATTSHDESRAQLPASTRVYVEGSLFPEILSLIHI
jgi:hypothetical protein